MPHQVSLRVRLRARKVCSEVVAAPRTGHVRPVPLPGAPPPAPQNAPNHLPNPRQHPKVPVTLHPSPFTLHPSPFTLHPSPFTLHPSPFTLHPTSRTTAGRRAAKAWGPSV
jgi:hypothetical protein